MKWDKHTLREESGSALIYVLLVIGSMSIAAGYIYKRSSDIFKQSYHSELQDQRKDAAMILREVVSCEKTLEPWGGNVAACKKGTPIELLKADKTPLVPKDGWKMNSWTVGAFCDDDRIIVKTSRPQNGNSLKATSYRRDPLTNELHEPDRPGGELYPLGEAQLCEKVNSTMKYRVDTFGFSKTGSFNITPGFKPLSAICGPAYSFYNNGPALRECRCEAKVVSSANYVRFIHFKKGSHKNVDCIMNYMIMGY